MLGGIGVAVLLRVGQIGPILANIETEGARIMLTGCAGMITPGIAPGIAPGGAGMIVSAGGAGIALTGGVGAISTSRTALGRAEVVLSPRKWLALFSPSFVINTLHELESRVFLLFCFDSEWTGSLVGGGLLGHLCV